MTFDKADLFRQAGYSEGDIIPIVSSRSHSDFLSTTSTTFTRKTGSAESHFLPPLPNDGGQTYKLAVGSLLKNDTGGESTTLRLVGVGAPLDNRPTVSFTAEGPNDIAIKQGDYVDYDASTASKLDDGIKVSGGTGTVEPIQATIGLQL